MHRGTDNVDTKKQKKNRKRPIASSSHKSPSFHFSFLYQAAWNQERSNTQTRTQNTHAHVRTQTHPHSCHALTLPALLSQRNTQRVAHTVEIFRWPRERMILIKNKNKNVIVVKVLCRKHCRLWYSITKFGGIAGLVFALRCVPISVRESEVSQWVDLVWVRWWWVQLPLFASHHKNCITKK